MEVEINVNAIFKVLALYNEETWFSYTQGLLPYLLSINPHYYHKINGLLLLHNQQSLTQRIVRKTVLDICNEINERPL